MSDALDRIMPFFKGLGAQFAEPIIRGLMIEWIGKIPIKEICDRVKRNERLWDVIPPEAQIRVKATLQGIKTDWFTVDWAIESVRKEHPAHASLFIGWPAGKAWLAEQIRIFREEIYGKAG